jgi:hypothetical protein
VSVLPVGAAPDLLRLGHVTERLPEKFVVRIRRQGKPAGEHSRLELFMRMFCKELKNLGLDRCNVWSGHWIPD